MVVWAAKRVHEHSVINRFANCPMDGRILLLNPLCQIPSDRYRMAIGKTPFKLKNKIPISIVIVKLFSTPKIDNLLSGAGSFWFFQSSLTNDKQFMCHRTTWFARNYCSKMMY